MDKVYVIVTDDGIYDDVFLNFDPEGDYYTTVAFLDEVGEGDLHSSVEMAEDRARDADSGTLFGWRAPMTICEVLNYDAVINDDEEPDLLKIKTIKFN